MRRDYLPTNFLTFCRFLRQIMTATTNDFKPSQTTRAMNDLTLSKGLALLAVIFVVNSIASSFGTRRKQVSHPTHVSGCD